MVFRPDAAPSYEEVPVMENYLKILRRDLEGPALYKTALKM